MVTTAHTQVSDAPSFKMAFAGFFGSLTLMTVALVLLGSIGA